MIIRTKSFKRAQDEDFENDDNDEMAPRLSPWESLQQKKYRGEADGESRARAKNPWMDQLPSTKDYSPDVQKMLEGAYTEAIPHDETAIQNGALTDNALESTLENLREMGLDISYDMYDRNGRPAINNIDEWVSMRNDASNQKEDEKVAKNRVVNNIFGYNTEPLVTGISDPSEFGDKGGSGYTAMLDGVQNWANGEYESRIDPNPFGLKLDPSLISPIRRDHPAVTTEGEGLSDKYYTGILAMTLAKLGMFFDEKNDVKEFSSRYMEDEDLADYNLFMPDEGDLRVARAFVKNVLGKKYPLFKNYTPRDFKAAIMHNSSFDSPFGMKPQDIYTGRWTGTVNPLIGEGAARYASNAAHAALNFGGVDPAQSVDEYTRRYLRMLMGPYEEDGLRRFRNLYEAVAQSYGINTDDGKFGLEDFYSPPANTLIESEGPEDESEESKEESKSKRAPADLLEDMFWNFFVQSPSEEMANKLMNELYGEESQPSEDDASKGRDKKGSKDNFVKVYDNRNKDDVSARGDLYRLMRMTDPSGNGEGGAAIEGSPYEFTTRSRSKLVPILTSIARFIPRNTMSKILENRAVTGLGWTGEGSRSKYPPSDLWRDDFKGILAAAPSKMSEGDIISTLMAKGMAQTPATRFAKTMVKVAAILANQIDHSYKDATVEKDKYGKSYLKASNAPVNIYRDATLAGSDLYKYINKVLEQITAVGEQDYVLSRIDDRMPDVTKQYEASLGDKLKTISEDDYYAGFNEFADHIINPEIQGFIRDYKTLPFSDVIKSNLTRQIDPSLISKHPVDVTDRDRIDYLFNNMSAMQVDDIHKHGKDWKKNTVSRIKDEIEPRNKRLEEQGLLEGYEKYRAQYEDNARKSGQRGIGNHSLSQADYVQSRIDDRMPDVTKQYEASLGDKLKTISEDDYYAGFNEFADHIINPEIQGFIRDYNDIQDYLSGSDDPMIDRRLKEESLIKTKDRSPNQMEYQNKGDNKKLVRIIRDRVQEAFENGGIENLSPEEIDSLMALDVLVPGDGGAPVLNVPNGDDLLVQDYLDKKNGLHSGSYKDPASLYIEALGSIADYLSMNNDNYHFKDKVYNVEGGGGWSNYDLGMAKKRAALAANAVRKMEERGDRLLRDGGNINNGSTSLEEKQKEDSDDTEEDQQSAEIGKFIEEYRRGEEEGVRKVSRLVDLDRLFNDADAYKYDEEGNITGIDESKLPKEFTKDPSYSAEIEEYLEFLKDNVFSGEEGWGPYYDVWGNESFIPDYVDDETLRRAISSTNPSGTEFTGLGWVEDKLLNPSIPRMFFPHISDVRDLLSDDEDELEGQSEPIKRSASDNEEFEPIPSASRMVLRVKKHVDPPQGHKKTICDIDALIKANLK